MFCIVCPTISHRKFQSHFILKNDESHDIHMTSSIWFLRISENAHHVPFIWSPQCLFLISPCLPMNIDENPMVIMANAHIMDDFPHYLILLPSYHPKVPLYLVIFPWVCHSSKSLKKKKNSALGFPHAASRRASRVPRVPRGSRTKRISWMNLPIYGELLGFYGI